MRTSDWKMEIKSGFHYLMVVITVVLIIALMYVTPETKLSIWSNQKGSGNGSTTNPLRSCNLFSGRWVYENKSQALYNGKECSFMEDGVACEKYGRKDLDYLNWRWQPHHCHLPRFDAKALLEKLRNKRLVFVGDSLNRNQWVSMVCMVEFIISPTHKLVDSNGSLVSFKALEYNASIDFYWAPFLVESNCDGRDNHRISNRIVRIQHIEKHARHWMDADYLVFNSYAWWRMFNVKILWGSFESQDGIYEDGNMLRSYEMTLQTWSDWLDVHINRTKTKLYFVSLSPIHNRAEEWGMRNGQGCYNETKPILVEGYWGTNWDLQMMRLVEISIDRLKARGLKAHILNITQLSVYRKEAHASIYRKYWQPLTEEQLKYPSSYADCIHWCLPGVPDVWNQLLYTYIFYF